MSVQLILKEGTPEYAVVPYDLYLQLVEDAEMLEDIRDYDEAMAALEAGEETFPASLVYALLDGGNPVAVWREYRGFSQVELAESADISTAYLSQIESGKRKGSAKVLARLAKSLNLTIDDLITSE